MSDLEASNTNGSDVDPDDATPEPKPDDATPEPKPATPEPKPSQGFGVSNSSVRMSMDPDGIHPDVDYKQFRYPPAGDPRNITLRSQYSIHDDDTLEEEIWGGLDSVRQHWPRHAIPRS